MGKVLSTLVVFLAIFCVMFVAAMCIWVIVELIVYSPIGFVVLILLVLSALLAIWFVHTNGSLF